MHRETSGALLFVYGSLKRGFCHHRELRGAEFVESARTAGQFELVRMAGYPVLLRGGVERVEGELYSAPLELLEALDRFEGPVYRREWVELADGRKALAYIGSAALLGAASPIAGGRWEE